MMKSYNASYWIDKLKLVKHPEGGFFAESYKCNEIHKQAHLPKRYQGDRAFATSIYFLIQDNDFSALHRIASDEIWHFYAGDSLNIYAFKDDEYLEFKLGSNHENRENFQVAIPHHFWFGAKLNKVKGYALVGCTVAPGFDFQDFEMGSREALLTEYPQYSTLIKTLTRN